MATFGIFFAFVNMYISLDCLRVNFERRKLERYYYFYFTSGWYLIIQQIVTAAFRFNDWFMFVVFIFVSVFLQIHQMSVVYTLLLDKDNERQTIKRNKKRMKST